MAGPPGFIESIGRDVSASALCIFALLRSSLAMGVRAGVFSLTIARLNLRIRNHLYRVLLMQEIGFFDKNHTGEGASAALT